MSRSLRLLATGLALVSLAATTWLFVRETTPFGTSRLAAAHAHLSDADIRALEPAIDYTDAVPVLNFHDVSPRPGPYSVTPSMFANQLAALRRAGFHTVSLAQVRDLVLGRRPTLPTRPVLLTFDDAVTTDYTRADPILAASGFTAVSFVDPSRLGDGRKPSYYLAWPQLRAMAKSGRWEFGSRVGAGGGDPAAALTDAALSRSVEGLRRGSGISSYAFAFPVTASALPTKPAAMARVRQVVERSFTLGFVSDLRSPYAVDAHTDPLLLPRFEVTAQVDVPALFAALRHMVPSPPGQSPATWGLSGAACTVSGERVTIAAPGYALCRSDLNGSRWTDYRLSIGVAGLEEKSTLVVLCRSGKDGDVELSVGSRLAVLRQLVHDRYSTLATWPTPTPGPGGTHTVAIDLVGATATVTVDAVRLGSAPLAPGLAAGPPGLGIAGGGTVTVTTATATDLRARTAG